MNFRRLLLPALLFLGAFAILLATIPDYGLTWDEHYYIEGARSIESWFGRAAESPGSISAASVKAGWEDTEEERKSLAGNVHPPFYKLSAIAFRHLLGKRLFANIVYQYRVSTAFWTAVLVLSLYLVILHATCSIPWALAGALAFLSVPRFFAHAHFFTTDMVVGALGFAGTALFAFGKPRALRILAGGLLFGAALATKFTGVLELALVLPLVAIAGDRRGFLLDYGALLLVACASFALFDLPVLFDPQGELAYYLSSVLDREKRLPVPTLYFGTIHDFRLPFHQPWVMLGITLPPVLAATALVGIPSAAYRWVQRRDPLSWFAMAPFAACMAVYMLPTTPKHDGIRLFSTAWPFIVLLGVTGCLQLQELVPWKQASRWAGLALFSTGILMAARETKAFHPFQLSYYNCFVGGARGAQERGFTVSYWYEAFNREFFARVGQVAGDREATVCSIPSFEIVEPNQAYGLSPTRLRVVGENDPCDYLLVLNRILYRSTSERLQGSIPLVELQTPDGAWIGGFYRAGRKQRTLQTLPE